jgi:tetratricopeptide (TPR) repeat protein
MNEKQAQQYFTNASNFYKHKKFDKAIELFKKLLKIFPDELNSKGLLALCYKEKKELRLAYDLLKDCIDKEPNNVFFLYSMGNVLSANKNYSDAIKCFLRALDIDKTSIDSLNGLAISYYNQDDFINAKKYFYISLKNNQNISIIGFLISIAKKELDYTNIIQLYMMALKINPQIYKTMQDIFYDMGTSYMNLSDYENAKKYFYYTVKLNPQDKKAYNSLGICHQNLLELDEAEKFYIQSFTIDSNFAKSHWNLSTLYLLKGDYKNGWKKYEWRKKMDNFQASTHGQLPSTTPYNGQNLKGKILSVKSEQGLGDTIQFVRFIKLFENKDIKKILLRVHNELVGLLKQFKSEKIEIVGEGNMKDLYSDYEIELLSLPFYFNTTIKTIPFSNKYISCTTNKPLNLSKNKKNIGIVWQGNSKNKNNNKRIIDLHLLKNIILLEEYSFFSLQKEDMQPEINKNNLQNKIINLSSNIETWEDTASFISQLDLIISIDTSIAHLSGAMGKKTILLLQYMPDFRWLLNTNKSPWYNKMSIIRQKQRDCWDNVLIDIELQLK